MRALAHPASRPPVVIALLLLTLALAACGTTTTTGTNVSAAGGSPTATTASSGGGYGGYGRYSSTPTTTAAATKPPANATQIDIGGTAYSFGFNPANVTIKAGTAVVWTNDSVAPHTVTSDAAAPAAFDSGTISTGGGQFSFTFTKPGTYHYHCSIHTYMKGTIVVTM
jgi:plastocyanin